MVKKTIKKITSISAPETKPAEPVQVSSNHGSSNHGSSNKEEAPAEQKTAKRRGCAFCESKKEPTYLDLVTIKRFISDRGKILPKGYTHLCAKHQRAVTKNIKYARHLSLLSFTPKV